MTEPKSIAGRVLRDKDSTPEAKTLAAYVLSDTEHNSPEGSATNPAEPPSPVETRYTEADLKRILKTIRGQAGQKQRVEAIEAQLKAMRGQ